VGLGVDAITGSIIDAAIQIHRRLGPGLFESVYEELLAGELVRRGHSVQRQRSVGFDYDGHHFENAFRIDLFVDELVVVEVKSLEKLAPVHSKQVLTYIRLLEVPVGLLINFGGATLKEGLHRIVNGYTRPPPGASA
jgi:GxxExxY protein